MAFFSGAEAASGAGPGGIRRSAVDSAAGFADFSCACLAAVFSMESPRRRHLRRTFSPHILSLLIARGDTRQCIEKVMSDGKSRSVLLGRLLRRCDQPDDFLHAGPV